MQHAPRSANSSCPGHAGSLYSPWHRGGGPDALNRSGISASLPFKEPLAHSLEVHHSVVCPCIFGPLACMLSHTDGRTSQASTKNLLGASRPIAADSLCSSSRRWPNLSPKSRKWSQGEWGFSALREPPMSTISLACASKGSCTATSRRAALLSSGCAANRTAPESLKTRRLHAFCATTRRYDDVRSTCTCCDGVNYPLKFDQFQRYAAASQPFLESQWY